MSCTHYIFHILHILAPALGSYGDVISHSSNRSAATAGCNVRRLRHSRPPPSILDPTSWIQLLVQGRSRNSHRHLISRQEFVDIRVATRPRHDVFDRTVEVS